MRSMRFPTALFFISILVVGSGACDRSPVSPGQEGPDGPAMSVASGPAQPGKSPVARFGFGEEFMSVDFARNLLAAYWNPDVLCAGGGPPVLQGQVITLPQVQAMVFHLQSAGPVPVTVLPALETFAFMDEVETWEEWCGYFTTQWLYRGTAVLRYQDNSADASPLRMNSWGWTANGNVQDQDGNAYRYLNRARFVVDPAAPGLPIHSSEVVQITRR